MAEISSAGSSDLALLREKLMEISAEDEDLRARVEEAAMLRFKTKYVKKDGAVVFFEIKEANNYKLADEAEVKLVFSPRERPAAAPLPAPPADTRVVSSVPSNSQLFKKCLLSSLCRDSAARLVRTSHF